jgi:hypothetical protein
MITGMDTKICTKCKEEKSVDDFNKRYAKGRSPDARRPDCKRCEYLRRKRTGLEERGWRKKRLAIYGLTLELYDELLAAQGGVCAICEEPPTRRPLDVDHCHTTLVVRGLLCPACNMGIGKFRDSTRLLDKAKKYLERDDHNRRKC